MVVGGLRPSPTPKAVSEKHEKYDGKCRDIVSKEYGMGSYLFVAYCNATRITQTHENQ